MMSWLPGRCLRPPVKLCIRILDERPMTDTQAVSQKADALAQQAAELAAELNGSSLTVHGGGVDPFIFGLTVFVLACFVGYYVVWRVTPALHTPLMAVTNAVSGIIIVGAIIAVGPGDGSVSSYLGFAAITLASVNIFGGFIVT